MLSYGTASEIASKVFADLDIPDDIYLTWDKAGVEEFQKKYLRDPKDSLIRSMVEKELANYDISENHPDDIEDIREGAIDEVFYMLDDYVERYYRYQNQITLNAYNEIVDVLRNTAFSNVVSVNVDYEPADPSVGIFNEERLIEFELSNGAYITFNVEIDED